MNLRWISLGENEDQESMGHYFWILPRDSGTVCWTPATANCNLVKVQDKTKIPLCSVQFMFIGLFSSCLTPIINLCSVVFLLRSFVSGQIVPGLNKSQLWQILRSMHGIIGSNGPCPAPPMLASHWSASLFTGLWLAEAVTRLNEAHQDKLTCSLQFCCSFNCLEVSGIISFNLSRFFSRFKAKRTKNRDKLISSILLDPMRGAGVMSPGAGAGREMRRAERILGTLSTTSDWQSPWLRRIILLNITTYALIFTRSMNHVSEKISQVWSQVSSEGAGHISRTKPGPPSLSQATFDIFDKLPRRSLPQGEPEIFCLDRDLNCFWRIAENN